MNICNKIIMIVSCIHYKFNIVRAPISPALQPAWPGRSGSGTPAPYFSVSLAVRYWPERPHFEHFSRTMAAGCSARLSDPLGMG